MSLRSKRKLCDDLVPAVRSIPIVNSGDNESVGLTDIRWKRFLFAGFAMILIFGLAGCWWLCTRSPRISFLTRHEPAQWVIYPRSPDAGIHLVTESRVVFRQTFCLERLPTQATLAIRAFKRFKVTLNGVAADVPAPPESNFKNCTKLDVAGMLHPGTNQIAVTVLNSDGPQALWLSLEADDFRLNSDGDWEASLEGGGWRKVRLASDPPPIEKGSPLFDKETVMGCFVRQLPLLLFFAVLSTGFFLAGTWWFKRNRGHGELPVPVDSTQFAVLVLVVMAGCWIALFVNNLGRLPVQFGFDVQHHLEYIDFIRSRHSLPLANQGWEMWQPPLYYIISAALAALLKLEVYSVAATQVFRGFGLLVGVAHLGLIFLCLRLLFPGRVGMQLFGLILAACLPEHLYISQYVTNESLADIWMTATIYFCLRLLKDNRPDWRLSVAGGGCLGGGAPDEDHCLYRNSNHRRGVAGLADVAANTPGQNLVHHPGAFSGCCVRSLWLALSADLEGLWHPVCPGVDFSIGIFLVGG